MHKYIGSDVTSMVTLPVIIFEPMTMLQKMAEVCSIYTKQHCGSYLALLDFDVRWPQSLLLAAK